MSTKAASLTDNQRRVLDFVRAYGERHGCPPSLREIAAGLGFARHSSAQGYIDALVRKGVLERLPQHRGLRLRESPASHDDGLSRLPLVGRVAAGQPILATEHVEGHYRVDAQLFHPRADYLLRVVGMSMRDAGILDGDLIAVHRAAEAGDGRIVVARLDDEVTVKRLQRHRNGIRLLPANPDFPPIEVDPARQSFAIEGLYVGLLRRD